jgi:hypothetical protein
MIDLGILCALHGPVAQGANALLSAKHFLASLMINPFVEMIDLPSVL